MTCPGTPRIMNRSDRISMTSVELSFRFTPGDVVDLLGASNSTVENNIARTTFSGSPALVSRDPSGRPDGGRVYKNNLTFDGTAGHAAWFIVDTTYSGTFAANDPLIGTNPQLANPGTGNQVLRDFHPNSGSPVIGAGIAVAGIPGALLLQMVLRN
jgi:hypothetical protein